MTFSTPEGQRERLDVTVVGVLDMSGTRAVIPATLVGVTSIDGDRAMITPTVVGVLPVVESGGVALNLALASLGAMQAHLRASKPLAIAFSGAASLSATFSASSKKSLSLAIASTGGLQAHPAASKPLAVGLSGSGKLTTAVTAKKVLALGIQATGSLSAVPSVGGSFRVSMTGQGALSATVSLKRKLAASVAGAGTLTATMSARKAMSLSMASTGSLSPTISAKKALALPLAGSGTMAATVAAKKTIAFTAAGVGSLAASLKAKKSLALASTGVGAMLAAVSAKKSLASSMAGTGSLTAAVTAGSASMYSQVSSILGSSLVGMVDATDTSARSTWTFATGGGADGSTISAVPDMTGARTFSQATAGSQPTLNTLSDGKKAIIWPNSASTVSLDPAAAWSFAWALVCVQYETGVETSFVFYESFLGVTSGTRLQGNQGSNAIYPNSFSNTASKNFSATQSSAILPLPMSTVALSGTPISQKWGLGTGDVSNAYWKGPIRGIIAANAVPNSTQLASIHALCQSYWGTP